MRDFLYLVGHRQVAIRSTAKVAVQQFLKKIRFLTKTEREVLTQLVDEAAINRNVANMSDSYFEIRFSIVNKIHKEALRLVA